MYTVMYVFVYVWTTVYMYRTYLYTYIQSIIHTYTYTISICIRKSFIHVIMFSLFCRSDEATAEMSELIQMSSNPDEINIASDDEEEEGDEKIEGM